jgi:hypothetical protein
VYNCGGYEALEVIQLLDGIVDIYLPDVKFLESRTSESYLDGAGDYPEVVCHVLKEMHRQVGDLVVDEAGIARRGLMVRHLVMPGMMRDSEAILHFIATELSPRTYVNIMDQYRPCFQAERSPAIARRTETRLAAISICAVVMRGASGWSSLLPSGHPYPSICASASAGESIGPRSSAILRASGTGCMPQGDEPLNLVLSTGFPGKFEGVALPPPRG